MFRLVLKAMTYFIQLIYWRNTKNWHFSANIFFVSFFKLLLWHAFNSNSRNSAKFKKKIKDFLAGNTCLIFIKQIIILSQNRAWEKPNNFHGSFDERTIMSGQFSLKSFFLKKILAKIVSPKGAKNKSI